MHNKPRTSTIKRMSQLHQIGLKTIILFFLVALLLPSYLISNQVPTLLADHLPSCTVTTNIAQVSPGDSFNLTVTFSDGTQHPFSYDFSTGGSFDVTPNTNPYTFTIISISDRFTQITIRPTDNNDRFHGCTVSVTNSTEPTSNDCTFETEPSDLDNLDNSSGNLNITVIITSGPTADYNIIFQGSGHISDITELTRKIDTPPFPVSVSAPTVVGTYRLDVTGVRQDNGATLDCNTVGGMLFSTLGISSGINSGAINTDTAGGIIEFAGTPEGFASRIIIFAIGISGGLAFLLIVFGSFKLIFSAGNPDAVIAGRQSITAAIVGLIVIIFSVFLLRLIGVSILGFGA